MVEEKYKKVLCPHCGKTYYLKDNAICPFCGADNSGVPFVAHEIPETIKELKQWYKDRNLPDEEVTRFFIGKNYTDPKAFGIYEDNGEFIVYKNKANGQRAIRYKGPNEAFAVKELYIRLKEEIINQKTIQGTFGIQEENSEDAPFIFKSDVIPTRLEELRQWYFDCEIPEKYADRFLIGEDYFQPNSIGIYEENGEFVVYKNERDGSKAICYRAFDEAEAVNIFCNEIKNYIKEGEETDKTDEVPAIETEEDEETGNPQKESVAEKREDEVKDRSHKKPVIEKREYEKTGDTKLKAGKKRKLPLLFVALIVIIFFYFFKAKPESFQYYRDLQGNIYVKDDILTSSGDNFLFNWYILDKDTGNWELYGTNTVSLKGALKGAYSFPAGHSIFFKLTSENVARMTGLSEDTFCFTTSKIYKKAHNYKPYESGYYLYKDDLYYYMDDDYGGNYNYNKNITGWYIYDTDDDSWDYVSESDGAKGLSSDLYYNYEDYECDDYMQFILDKGGSDRNQFENSELYSTYEDSKEAFREYWYGTDSDDSYDWDSDDSWDSDDTDWDSDW